MTITSGDVALAGPLILGLMGVIVTFIPNNSIGNKRIYLIIAFVILYAITFGAQRIDKRESDDRLFGGNNFVVVSALRHPSIAVGGVLQARNEGDIPLPNPAFAVSPPESPTWDKPGYASFGYWGTFVLPAHDSRITGIVLKPGEYILDLTASNGPAYETLTIPSSNDASKQHVKITKNGVVVYDKDINF